MILYSATTLVALALSIAHAQATIDARWEAVLADLHQSQRNIWLANKTLRPREFWEARGDLLDTLWVRGLVQRGIIVGSCKFAACPKDSGAIVIVLQKPAAISADRATVRFVRFLHRESVVKQRCGDSVAAIPTSAIDMESFEYRLERGAGGWVITDRSMRDGGHAADSAAMARLAACERRG